MTWTDWRPAQYELYADQRLRPALELLDRIPCPDPHEVVDLGCGTGRVTAFLARRWPRARVTGVDNSQAMLERVPKAANLRWVEADIAAWRPDSPPDVLYSNAALHWLPDHATLFPQLVSLVASGGALAVQMPLSWEAPSHRLMREVLAQRNLGSASLREKLNRRPVATAATYYDLLRPRCRTLDIWETEYLQVLSGEHAVLEWVRSTGLRPVLNGLDAASLEAFLETYTKKLLAAYPPRSDGTTLYPFRRLFLVGIRA